MKKYLLIALFGILTVGQSFGAQVKYLQCDVNGEEDALLMSSWRNNWSAYLKRAGTGYVGSDSCYSINEAPLAVKGALTDLKKVAAVCVFVNSGDGSGDMIVIGKGKDQKVQMGYVDVSTISKSVLTDLNCY